MKKFAILFIILNVISTTIFCQTNPATDVDIYVTVTDFEGNISVGDEIGFVSKNYDWQTEGISDENGKFIIQVPRNDTYQITIKSFDGNTNYTAIQVPADENAESYSITVMYQLPKTYILKDINFDTGKSTLKQSSFETLNNLVELLENKPEMKIELSGHTDDVGDDDFNLKLSESRAKSVKQYLTNKGIDANRITAIGYGESQPIASNSDDEGRSLNRRTEVKILE